MPYKNLWQKRERDRVSKRLRYWTDPEFRASESERKAEWLQTPEGKSSNAAASHRYRRAHRAIR